MTDTPDRPLDPAQPGLVGTSALAAALGVTAQSIRNYAREGMPVAGRTPDGHARYDLAACQAWHKANKPEPAHGGRRPGAGRKPGTQTIATPGGGPPGPPPPPAGVALAGLPTTPEGIIEALGRGDIDLATARQIGEAIKAASGRQRLDQERGELLERADVEKAWRGHLAELAAALRTLPRSMTPAVLAAAGLGPDRAHDVEHAIERQVHALMRRLAVGGVGQAAA